MQMQNFSLHYSEQEKKWEKLGTDLDGRRPFGKHFRGHSSIN